MLGLKLYTKLSRFDEDRGKNGRKGDQPLPGMTSGGRLKNDFHK